MPNHVKNRIRMKGIAQLPLFVKCDDGGTQFDFEKIIPKPESLEVEAGSKETEAIAMLIMKLSTAKFVSMDVKVTKIRDFREHTEEEKQELLELGVKYAENIVKYGHSSWYEWCIANWGTKWNAYCTEIVDDDTITFETAWSNPEPILTKLAEMYPEAHIEHEWADEDAGNNSGYREYDGKEWFGDYDCDDDTALERYMDLWGESGCFSKDEDGHWKRNNCETCHGCD